MMYSEPPREERAATRRAEEGTPPSRSNLAGAAWAVLASGALAIAGAVIVGVALVMEGFLLGGFPMGFVAMSGGPVLGGALGLGLGLWMIARRASRRAGQARAPRLSWILRAFPDGRAGALSAWALSLLLLASPYALLSVGGLPPDLPARIVVTALLAAICFLQCARRGSFWPALVLPLWPVLTVAAMGYFYPCWRASNAAWCGHMCDSPPGPRCRPGDFGTPRTSDGEPP
jgi:hypothetical protein